jgi:hypothetical protein
MPRNTATTIHFVPTSAQASRIDDLVDGLPRTSRSAVLRFVLERGLDGLTPDELHAAVQADPMWLCRQPRTRRPHASGGKGATK